MEYRPLEGFVFAVTPFNFTAIAGNLTSSPALMGNTVVWKPAVDGDALGLLPDAALPGGGLPDGVINLVYGTRRDDRRRRAREPAPRRHPLHRLDAASSTACGRRSATNIERYRNYPRIVGETGGKDFIVAHPSADVDVARGRDRARLVRVPGPEVLAPSSRVYAPSNLWPELRERLQEEVATIKMGDVADFGNFMGAVIDSSLVRDAGARRSRRRRRTPTANRRRRRLRRLRRATSSSRR